MKGLVCGRIVNFVDENYNNHPAMVTRIHNEENGTVNLDVVIDSVTAINHVARFSMSFSDGNEPCTWNWMPKE